ncbi:hypothetical protein B0I37DRAFT_366285 [Chaetomium sp. MPI-CAGE-AT-0009]|nr:hypothetical protein B0I37DRAFT_366285 [Chaetomium sp. MPI-CAGE-AT-0009]
MKFLFLGKPTTRQTHLVKHVAGSLERLIRLFVGPRVDCRRFLLPDRSSGAGSQIRLSRGWTRRFFSFDLSFLGPGLVVGGDRIRLGPKFDGAFDSISWETERTIPTTQPTKVRWCSWLSRQSNTLKVSSSSLDRIIVGCASALGGLNSWSSAFF